MYQSRQAPAGRKKYRICDNRDFRRLYGKGKYVSAPYAVAYFRKNPYGFNRVGFTASKKIGKAHVRNRARRVLAAAYRQARELLPQGYDIVFVARTATAQVKSGKVYGFIKYKLAPAMAQPGKTTRQAAGKQ